MKNLAQYAKALGGAILSGLITLAAVAVGAQSAQDVTFIQWVLVAISTLGTGIGVYAIPNRPPSTAPSVARPNFAEGIHNPTEM